MYEHIWMNVMHEMTQVQENDFDLAPNTWFARHWGRENCDAEIEVSFRDKNDWNHRHWMNTPGPIYTTQSDNCGTGMMEAPHNVRYYADGYEVVYRQPVNRIELIQVASAAMCDPFGSYGCDGNSHWNRHHLREWWARRDELKAEIERLKATRFVTETPDYTGPQDYDAWLAYLDGDCLLYLRVYAFFLENERAPQKDDFLPEL